MLMKNKKDFKTLNNSKYFTYNENSFIPYFLNQIMLEISDIIELWEEDVVDKVIVENNSSESKNSSIKGKYNSKNVFLYEKDIHSKEEFDKTLIHTFYNAKLNLNGNHSKLEDCSNFEEETYKNNYGIVSFIIKFYNVKIPEKFR